MKNYCNFEKKPKMNRNIFPDKFICIKSVSFRPENEITGRCYQAHLITAAP